MNITPQQAVDEIINEIRTKNEISLAIARQQFLNLIPPGGNIQAMLGEFDSEFRARIITKYNQLLVEDEMFSVAACRGKNIGAAPSALLTGLSAFWKLEEDGATERAEYLGISPLTSGNSAITAEAGKVGNCNKFIDTDLGGTHFLYRASNANLALGADTAFTWAVWVQINDKSKYRGVLTKRGTFASGLNFVEYQIYYDTVENRYRFVIGNGSANADVKADVYGSPAVDTWAFIVAWHDPVANTINIQVDNGTVDSLSWSGGTYASTNQFRIGTIVTDDDFILRWKGKIDAAGLWNGRVLSLGERALLYNGGAGREAPFA